jgi:lysophospholipase
VVYLANGAAPLGQTPVTNFSTFTDTFSVDTLQSVLDQVFDVVTQGIPVNGTMKDLEWPACLTCAVVDRARNKAGMNRSGVCADCFARYCFSN